jgi:hypothetical protein
MELSLHLSGKHGGLAIEPSVAFDVVEQNFGVGNGNTT